MVFGRKNITVDIVKHEHANMESFPFRYGMHFEKTTQLDLFNCRNYSWQIYEKKFEVEANFVSQKNQIETGRFVIKVTKYPNPKVKTVMRDDTETEFHLSSLIKSLRENGEISPADLIDWHPLYLSGQANTFAKFAALFYEKKQNSRNKNIAKILSQAKDAASEKYKILLITKEQELLRTKSCK